MMMVLVLTVALISLMQVQQHGCVRPPTRNLSVLDRMPQGLGKRDPLPPTSLDQLPSLLTNIIPHSLEHNAYHPEMIPNGGRSTRLLGDALRLQPSTDFQENIHDLGDLLRRRENHQRRLESLQKLHGGSSLLEGSRDQVDKDSRLVLFYTLPRSSSDKRGRRVGWRPRGRRGKGWALGGKRQAVLDRMPLSYGKKRDAWGSFSSSFQQVNPEGGESFGLGTPAFRGKRDIEDRLEPV
ncbi:hypothetical protein ACOMHN_047042 [Nucella lapillus]